MSSYSDSVLRIQPSNLIGYWPFWEDSGNIAYDISGYENSGSYTSGIILNQDGIGDGETSILCTGSNSISLSGLNLLSLIDINEFTVSLWFKVANSGVWLGGTTRYIFDFAASNVANRIALFRPTSTNNTLTFIRTALASSLSVVDSNWGSYDGWIHFCATISFLGDYLKVYKNGIQVGNTQTGLVTSSVQLFNLKVGSQFLGVLQFWQGYIAHLAIWNMALNDTDVKQLPSLGLPKSSIRIKDELYYSENIRDR